MSLVSLLLSDKAKARFDAFSDGVFAIVITLLVLELHVPTGRHPLWIERVRRKVRSQKA